MRQARAQLQKIEALFEPKHLFILPEWADSKTLDALLRQGFFTCRHLKRDADGRLQQLMGIELTETGHLFLHRANCLRMAFAGMVGIACVIIVSFVFLNSSVAALQPHPPRLGMAGSASNRTVQ